MSKGLNELISQKDEFDEESKLFIDKLNFAQAEIDTINSMKRTDGWKLLENRIREQLHTRINNMVKDDAEISTLLALLGAADTKTHQRILDEEIDKLLM